MQKAMESWHTGFNRQNDKEKRGSFQFDGRMMNRKAGRYGSHAASPSCLVNMKNTPFFKLKPVLLFGIIGLWLRPGHNLKRKEE